MKPTNEQKVNDLIETVNKLNQGIDIVAQVDTERAYGGIIRSAKGKLVENLCKELIKIAWDELDGSSTDLSFSDKTIPIPLKREYIDTIKSLEIRNWIENNYSDFVFKAQVDVHVLIKNKFVLGIECKAYTENAMLKRILVDFTLLKTQYPSLKCGLLQLESQLTGDYCKINNDIIYGSHSTHSLMSYFDVDLNIMTLLEGERKVDRPIHKHEFFKPLTFQAISKIINTIKNLLLEYR